MLTAIQKIEKHVEQIRNNGEHDTVRPGMPFRFSEAAEVGDGVWQGDLGFELVDRVPDDYVRAETPSVQLVPGTTLGARHCLDSLDGVEQFLPPGWDPQYTGLRGPCNVFSKERSSLHPVHGPVTFLAGSTALSRYQREWDAEQRRARRSAD